MTHTDPGNPAGIHSGTSQQRGDWWSRRPRRSRTDSKIGGVAGGLGHYLGVDPILFRVGFVALTILGGAGVLVYSVLWLLLPADGDEVSAGEALVGRGRSSVSPVLAGVLALAVLITIVSSGAWGLPFWPAVIIAVIAIKIAHRRRRGPFRPGSDWQQRVSNATESFRSGEWQSGQSWGQGGSTQGWNRHGSGWGHGQGCGSSRSRDAQKAASTGATGSTGPTGFDNAPSPFETPAFWEQTGPGATGGSTATGGVFHGPATGPIDPSAPTGSGSEFPDSPYARSTPPAWDPLGAAPFAWDLPDVDLTPDRTSTQTLARRRDRSPVIARVTMGTVFTTAALQILGMIAGWWVMSWAAISGTALAIVAAGLIVQSLRGKMISLVGPGLLLSVLTVGLALTGLSGTATVGNRSWTPVTAAEVQSHYELSTGDAELDLTGIQLRAGQTVNTSVSVNAGQVTVLVPADVTVTANCTANAGQIDCGGIIDEGLNNNATWTEAGEEGAGSVHLDVHVGTGDVQVRRG